MAQPSKISRTKVIKAYNQAVKGFKQTWGVLRAISLVLSQSTEELTTAKQRIKELQKKITSVERLIRKNELEEIPDKIKMLGLELRIFKELIEQIVSGVDTADVRRFFQKTHDTRDDEIVELIKFFHDKGTLTEDDVDKVDLLITEVCTTRVGYKRVIKPDFEVGEVYKRIFEDEVSVHEYEEAVLEEFNTATNRIDEASDIDEIIKNEMIATMRDFKKEIAELFINPRVFEVALNYNVTLNNKLVAILKKDEGEIQKASELAEEVEGKLSDLSPGQQQTAHGLVEKVVEIQESYEEAREGKSYDIKLIVEAAKQRKAIQESIDKLKEIKANDAAQKEEAGFKRKTIQAYINEIFRGLLKLDGSGDESIKIKGLKLDLKKMDPWERSLFLMDTQTLGEDQRMFEALREAIVLRSKITEEYKASKNELERADVEALITENLEVASHLSDELQGFMDIYDRRTRTFSIVDLMKVKSGLKRSIKRLKSRSRMDGYSTEKKS